jgi:AraC-like DNA-binding protein
VPTLLIYVYGAVFLHPISNENLENLWATSNSLSDVSLLAHRKFLMLYRSLLYIGYGLFILKIAKKHIFNGQEQAKIKWIRSFLALYFLYFAIGVAHTIVYTTVDTTVGSIMSMNLLKYTNIIAAYTFLYFIFKNPDVIYGHVFERDRNTIGQQATAVSEPTSEPAASFIAADKEPLKANDIKLPDEKAAAYFEEISSYLMETGAFLKQDLMITDLSHYTKIPAHFISYSIGKIEQKNFREYINSLRIQHFIQQYEEQSGKYTIDTIAENSGFRSKATFYTAFKRQTGKTPADYFKSVENTDECV